MSENELEKLVISKLKLIVGSDFTNCSMFKILCSIASIITINGVVVFLGSRFASLSNNRNNRLAWFADLNHKQSDIPLKNEFHVSLCPYHFDK